MSENIYHFKKSYFDTESLDLTYQEYCKVSPQYPYVCEFTSHQEIKKLTPFADFDMNFDSEEDLPTDEEEEEIRKLVIIYFESIFLNNLLLLLY